MQDHLREGEVRHKLFGAAPRWMFSRGSRCVSIFAAVLMLLGLGKIVLDQTTYGLLLAFILVSAGALYGALFFSILLFTQAYRRKRKEPLPENDQAA